MSTSGTEICIILCLLATLFFHAIYSVAERKMGAIYCVPTIKRIFSNGRGYDFFSISAMPFLTLGNGLISRFHWGNTLRELCEIIEKLSKVRSVIYFV